MSMSDCQYKDIYIAAQTIKKSGLSWWDGSMHIGASYIGGEAAIAKCMLIIT